jgi:hypothetical protein
LQTSDTSRPFWPSSPSNGLISLDPLVGMYGSPGSSLYVCKEKEIEKEGREEGRAKKGRKEERRKEGRKGEERDEGRAKKEIKK